MEEVQRRQGIIQGITANLKGCEKSVRRFEVLADLRIGPSEATEALCKIEPRLGSKQRASISAPREHLDRLTILVDGSEIISKAAMDVAQATQALRFGGQLAI
eukprot:3911772-Prymnesium_polylepis.3